MSWTEDWVNDGLGSQGRGQWNRFGTWLPETGNAVRNYFTCGNDGLEWVLSDAARVVSNTYTWHGYSPDVVYGSFAVEYRATTIPENGTLATYFSVGIEEATGKYLWVRHAFTHGGSHQICEFRTGTSPWATPAVSTGTSTGALEGDWSTSAITIRVKYLDNGTFEGSFIAVDDATPTTTVITMEPSEFGTYAPGNMILGIKGCVSNTTEEITWQMSSYHAPYNRNYLTAPSRLDYIGTWGDGTVGFLPLGDRIMRIGDVTDYGFLPNEHRGWSSTMSVTLDDSDSFLLNNFLGTYTSTSWTSGSFEARRLKSDASYGLLYCGLVDTFEYDYANKTLLLNLESPWSSVAEQTLQWGTAPFAGVACGSLYRIGVGGDGGSCIIRHSAFYLSFASKGGRAYVNGSIQDSKEILGVGPIEYFISQYRRTIVLDDQIPAGATIGKMLYTVRPWPSEEGMTNFFRESPNLMVDEILSNLHILPDSSTVYTDWQQGAALTYVEGAQAYIGNEKAKDVFFDLMSTLNSAFSFSPEGRIRFFCYNPLSTRVGTINFGSAYQSSWSVASTPRVDGANVSYGWDPLEERFTKTTQIALGSSLVDAISLSSRFIQTPSAAMAMGARAARDDINPRMALTLDVEPDIWDTLLPGMLIYLEGASDYLGALGNLTNKWILSQREYLWESNQVRVRLIQIPQQEFVEWDDTILDCIGRWWY